ncbi:MAG: gluconokinase [Bacteroidota bacterium]
MKEYVLAIDIGTTSTKAVAFSKTGELLQEAREGYPILRPQPNYQEQNPAGIYEALMKAAKTVIEVSEKAPLAISFSSAMHSLILLDEDDKLLTNSIIWADGRSQKYANELNAKAIGKDIYKQTGTPIHPMSPLCKIAWFRDQEASTFEQTARFISIKEYVLQAWFDRFVVDESIASATGLFDIHHRTWYKPALDYCGIKESQLSESVPTTYILKNLKEEISEQLQIPNNTPVVIGASDGCLANLGAGVRSMGKAVISIGTSAAIRMTNDAPILDVDAQLFNYILDEDHYVIGGPSNNGGVIYEWFQATFGEVADASKIGVGADRLLFLPYLMGERAPIWNTDARAAFIGLRKSHTKVHLLRAVLEGIVMNLYQIAQALEQQEAKIEAIYANGGFTQNDLAVQILADVFNVKVHLQAHEEGTALGAALLAFRALSIAQDIGTQTNESFTPDPAAHQTYQAYFEIWKGLYSRLEESFVALQKL